ncbi:ficolin-1 [Culex quinquefasciatus]|uniref:ficolin-1 n=1 Tax=Culex quinquefasciatus TaxID=7176 RepID=UPI0018E3C057|nr:ficolin-1 [Culex quinquefasciatus]
MTRFALAAGLPREITVIMLVVTILGCFLMVTSVASSQDEPDASSLWERRLSQLELKLQNFSDVQNSILSQQSSLLESWASQFNQMLTLQTKHQQRIIKSCDEATTSGRYRLELPDSSVKPVVCDMKELDGGWLVIQRRFSGAVSFNRSWAEYRDGFGSVGKSGEFWLGLEPVHQLTAGGGYELLVKLEYEFDEGYARYQRFELAGEGEGYEMLALDEYHGNMGNQMQFTKNIKFSTYDRNYDERATNCPQVYGCGWWFNGCRYA